MENFSVKTQQEEEQIDLSDDGITVPSEEVLLRSDGEECNDSEAKGSGLDGFTVQHTGLTGIADVTPGSGSQSENGSAATVSGSNSQGSTARPKMCGAAKRRLAWWLSQGKTVHEAKALCTSKLESIPEYHIRMNNRDEQARAEGSQQLISRPGGESRPDKRPRSASSLSQERPGKTAKMGEASLTYAEKAKAIRVGIKGPSGVLSSAQCGEIEGEILRLVDLEEEGKGPGFQGSFQRAGVYIVQCADEFARDWLIARAGQLKPWEGASLTAVREEELPRPRLAVAWIPDAKLNKEAILRRLRTQNKQIDLSHWRVVVARPESKGQTVTFSLDESSCEALASRNNRLYLGMTVIQLRLKGPVKVGTDVQERERPMGTTSATLHREDMPSPADSAVVPGLSPVVEHPIGGLPTPKANQTQVTNESDVFRQARSWAEASSRVSRASGSTGTVVPAFRGRGAGPWRGGRGRNASSHRSPAHASTDRQRRGNRGATGASARGPAQLPSLAQEHSSRKASKNPLNSR